MIRWPAKRVTYSKNGKKAIRKKRYGTAIYQYSQENIRTHKNSRKTSGWNSGVKKFGQRGKKKPGQSDEWSWAKTSAIAFIIFANIANITSAQEVP